MITWVQDMRFYATEFPELRVPKGLTHIGDTRPEDVEAVPTMPEPTGRQAWYIGPGGTTVRIGEFTGVFYRVDAYRGPNVSHVGVRDPEKVPGAIVLALGMAEKFAEQEAA